MKALIDKIKLYTKTRPNRSRVIFAFTALLVLALISMGIALLTRDTTPNKTSTGTVLSAQVTITPKGFVPETLSVKRGTKITWTNTDTSQHQIIANPHPTGESLPGLKSEILNSNQTYEYTADTAGTFGYHDKINPTINGTLDVQE